MQADVPIIYHRQQRVAAVPGFGRLLAGALALACLSVLVIASRLTPNPDGLGTHRAMGLPECAFLERTGLPCPSCGMTTSFAWFVRGRFLTSVYVQPMGAFLAAVSGMAIWIGFYILLTGRPVYRLFAVFHSQRVLILMLGFGLVAWGWKIFIHLKGID